MYSRRVQVIKNPPRDRSKFEHLVGTLSVTVESTSYLHISSTQYALQVKEEELAKLLDKHKDLTEELIRNIIFEDRYLSFNLTANVPSIPASSIKGNVRSRIELSFKEKGGRVRSCFIRATKPTRPPAVGMHGWRHFQIWGEILSEDRAPTCDLTTHKHTCLVCDIFGTTGLQALVRFSDFVGREVRLDRLNLGYGMNVLAAPPNSRFNGFIDFLNLKPEELGLLFIGMGLRDSIKGKEVLLGRFKYIGKMGNYRLGRAVYLLEKIRLSEFSEPIRMDGITLEPGQTLEGEVLSNLIKALVANALDSYKEELDIKDEVSIVEKLQ